MRFWFLLINIHKMHHRFNIICLLCFILSCRQAPSHSAQAVVTETPATITTAAKDSFENGKIIDPVINNINSSQSFALYFPKNYSASSTYPVVYFFDSHGSGRFPLDKYSALADEFNFILIGSNDSKNGMQPEALMNIANNLMQDAEKRFSIDSSRKYLAGFSGGARVAGLVAMQTPGIAGVIACSAAINSKSENNIPFALVGIAGKEDFNMTELIALNKQLDKTPVSHQLLLFNGKHEWCPLSTMKDAFLFLETDAMRNKTVSVNNSLLSDFKTAEEKKAKKLRDANQLTQAAETYEKLIHYLRGLQDIKQYEQTLQALQQNKNYQNERLKEDQLIAQENQLRDHYFKSFGKEIPWWQNEVSKINDEIARQGNSDAAFMLKRMLGSLSLASYMEANTDINANQLSKADYILQIYRLVDPTNSEAWYLSAEVHAKQGSEAATINELQKAIDNGFKERDRMVNDPAFAPIANTKEFNTLLNKIKDL